jgi:hypothetical protein
MKLSYGVDVLISREKDIEYSWHPGCSYMGIGTPIGGLSHALYAVGAIGRRGPGVTEEDLKKSSNITEVPKCLALYIKIKKDAGGGDNLYLAILGSLGSLVGGGDPIQVIPSQTRQIKEKLAPKDEYKKQIAAIEAKNKSTIDGLNFLKRLISEVCLNAEDLLPKLSSIPDEWYDWNEYTDYPTIEVRCHSGTEFYKFMDKNSIFTKYFPEWYKNGNF